MSMNEKQPGEIKRAAVSGFIWRLLQNAGTQVISFVLSIILARLLTPDDYGLVAMVTVFTAIALVFVNTGFSSAVIQRKHVTEDELSAVFFCGIFVACGLYLILFLSAPYVARFYGEPQLTAILRVQAISLILAAVGSVSQALIVRDMKFRKGFVIGLTAALAQGVVGIFLAFCGWGVWALLVSALTHQLVNCVLVMLWGGFRPKPVFSFVLVRPLFAFSSKILLTSLMDTVFNNLRSLLIGKVYSSADLAYYNRGFQFPSLIMTQVDGSMTTVLFSTLSKFQDDWDRGLSALRQSMRTSLFVCAPLMAGLCAVAEPMVRVLLTDKWLPCVSYIRIVSILCVFWPLSAKSHALNARGFSGISMKLNLVKQVLGVLVLLATFRISVFALVASGLVTAAIGFMIELVVFRKYLDYRMRDQLADIMPTFGISAGMGLLVYPISFVQWPSVVVLAAQVLAGVILYVGLSWLLNRGTFLTCAGLIRGLLGRRGRT